MNSSHHKSCVTTPDGFLAFEETCFDLKIVYFVSGWHYYSLTGIMIFDVALIPPATIMNVLTVMAVARNRSLQSVSNILLSSLAVSDALTGMVVQPIIVRALAWVLNCQSVCWIFVTSFQTGYFLAIVSFLTLTTVTLDRYIAIHHPFRYQNYTISKGIVYRIIAMTWFAPLTIVAVSFATSRMWLQQLSLAILAPFSLCVSVFAQIKTVRTVRHAQKRDVRLSVGPQDGTNSKEQRKKYINGKATKVATLILVAMIVCYMPQSVLTLLRMVLQKHRFGFQGIYDWAKTLVLICSSLNPIIYCLHLKEMRRKIFAMVCYRRNERKLGISQSSFATSNTTRTRRSTRDLESAL